MVDAGALAGAGASNGGAVGGGADDAELEALLEKVRDIIVDRLCAVSLTQISLKSRHQATPNFLNSCAA